MSSPMSSHTPSGFDGKPDHSAVSGQHDVVYLADVLPTGSHLAV